MPPRLVEGERHHQSPIAALGRNIGDIYFGVSDEHNYRDLDVLAAGPIVSDISESFDVYWNSPWAVPIAELGVVPSQAEAEAVAHRVASASGSDPSQPLV